MTILKPHAGKNLLSFLLFTVSLILLGGFIYIYEYNAFVNARHDFAELKESLVKLQTVNADLRNEFYKAIEPAKLGNLARERKLFLEKRPEYITSNLWLSDLSH